MNAGPQPSTSHRRPPRPAVLVSVLACTLALALTACGSADPRRVEAVDRPTPVPSASDLPEPAAAPVGRPVSVEIPAIEVAAAIVEVGLEPGGAMEVPDFGLAGWYGVGPRPGEPGPAVVVAHVDSKAGPDVFFRLRELQAGDLVTITAEDGATHTFAVTHQEQSPKDQLPTDRIWDDGEEPVLRLITCGGSFDRNIGHYRDNVIVYATAVPA